MMKAAAGIAAALIVSTSAANTPVEACSFDKAVYETRSGAAFLTTGHGYVLFWPTRDFEGRRVEHVTSVVDPGSWLVIPPDHTPIEYRLPAGYAWIGAPEVWNTAPEWIDIGEFGRFYRRCLPQAVQPSDGLQAHR